MDSQAAVHRAESGAQPIVPTRPGADADRLQRYLEATRRIPPLSAEQERRLGCALRERNELAAARTLVAANLRHVISIARRYLGYGLPLADLIQEGTIGLMKAVRRFDPGKGARLMAFADHWIRAEITEYVIRNWSIVRIASTKAQRKLFFRLRGSKPDAGRLDSTSAARIAAGLHVPPEQVLAMDARLAARDASLDVPRGAEGERPPLAASLADPADLAGELMEQETARRRAECLRRTLKTLDRRSRAIIVKRWLSGERKTELRELARDHRVSIERVRQIQNRAFAQLRHAIEQPAAA